MWPYLTGEFGNPSSHHSLGESAAAALAGARASVASALGCRPGELTFTSGGTEADNLAIKGIALARQAADPRLNRILISAIEHPAVEESARYLERFHGFTVDVVPVDGTGLVTPEAFAGCLHPGTAVASVMYANNEVGTVQPVAALAALAHGLDIPFHTDAVQAAGWLPLDTKALGVDAMSISGHKLGAPKGCGVLFVRSRTRLEPLLHGGGQERGRRSGTENVASAVGLATALTMAKAGQPERSGHVADLRDGFIAAVLAGVPGAVLHRTSLGAAAIGGVVLLPRDQRRIGPAGPGTPGGGVFQRFRVRCWFRRAVAGAHRHGFPGRGGADRGAVQLRRHRQRWRPGDRSGGRGPGCGRGQEPRFGLTADFRLGPARR